MSKTLQQLAHLESIGLVSLAQTHPELEYLFRHALVQDAAYESLLISDRRRLHLLFKGLVEETPEMDIVLGVAQSWDVLDNGREYVFQSPTLGDWNLKDVIMELH